MVFRRASDAAKRLYSCANIRVNAASEWLSSVSHTSHAMSTMSRASSVRLDTNSSSAQAMACIVLESEQQHVVTLVRKKDLSRLEQDNNVW